MKRSTPSILLVALVSGLLFQACVIEQNYTFKKDFSGMFETRIDLSAVAESAGSEFGADTIFTPEALREMESTVMAFEGISNARSTFENNVLSSAYSFDGLTSLNAATKNADQTSQGMYTFSSKGKTLLMKFNKDAASALISAESEAAMAMEMFTFELNIYFEEEIKSVKGKKAEWDKGTNVIHISIPLKEIAAGVKDMDIEVRLK